MFLLLLLHDQIGPSAEITPTKAVCLHVGFKVKAPLNLSDSDACPVVRLYRTLSFIFSLLLALTAALNCEGKFLSEQRSCPGFKEEEAEPRSRVMSANAMRREAARRNTWFFFKF